MQVNSFETKEDWLIARRGKITGSSLKDIIVKRGTGKKIGFYKLIAERLAIPEGTEENAMDRGTRLELEALERFEKETGKKVDNSLVIWSRDDNASIAISPDGIISETEAVEVKCLASERHIQALLEDKVPDDYWEQVLQYFAVNDKLETLYFAMYDPRLYKKDFFYFTITREQVQEEVTYILDYQKQILAEVEQITNELTF